MEEIFKNLCLKAIKAAQRQSSAILDFRVWKDYDPEEPIDPTPDIYAATDQGIEEMFNSLDFGYDFDCELFFNYTNGAVSAEHGIKYKDEHLTWY